jgi:hypothetical protein
MRKKAKLLLTPFVTPPPPAVGETHRKMNAITLRLPRPRLNFLGAADNNFQQQLSVEGFDGFQCGRQTLGEDLFDLVFGNDQGR